MISTSSYTKVLTIAGSDSGGGAGIQADLKTIEALGCFGLTAIAAITAQNTVGVQAVYPLAAEQVRAQLDSIFGDMGADAVKIGLLAPGIPGVVADRLRHYGAHRIVLDPVMVATSGDVLLAERARADLVLELFPMAAVVTPNIAEAQTILGSSALIGSQAQMREAGSVLLAQTGAQAVLLKGGHNADAEAADLLLEAGGRATWLLGQRIATDNTHGTGCTLSSAIACYLAKGLPLAEACKAGKAYLQGALAAGANRQLGAGHGPVWHSWQQSI